MRVPLLDLAAQFATIRDEVVAAVTEVLESRQYINGPAVSELERRIAAYCGCTAAVAASSGTDAILCSLMALGLGKGDEVITTPYTFFATAGCISRVGARPVLVDIEPDTFNVDPGLIKAAVTKKTRAIIPVHLFGQMADMDPIMELAGLHGLLVIEDAAQAIGATYKGRRACSIGIAGCLSFYPTKNLGGLGDGGMIVTNDAELAKRMAILRNHGAEPKYHHKWIGGNFRMDTIQAAGLLVKLVRLDDWSARRRANAERYDALLADCDEVKRPTIRSYNVSIFNQYVIRVPRREELRAFLTKEGIGTEIYYPLALHQQECFTSLGYKAGDFPASERAAAESLALPIYPELSIEQIEYVVDAIKRFFG